MQSSPYRSWLLILVFVGAAGCSSDGGRAERTPDSSVGQDTAAGVDTAPRNDSGDTRTGSPDSNRPDAGPGTGDTGREVEWRNAPPVGSGPRQEHDVAVLDSKLYLIGGYDDGPEMQASVEVYDPATESWSSSAPFPEPLHHANVAVVDETIYVVGYLVENFRAKGDVYAYEPSADTWTSRGSMPSDRARGASAVAAIDGRIYVAGGIRGGSAVALSSVYDPESDSWRTLPDAPRPFDHAAAGALDGRLVVAGGRDTNIAAHSDRVDIFDPETRTWSTGTPMPTGRGGVASTVWNGYLIVAGGEGNIQRDSGVFPQVEAYDASADTWTSLPDLEHPRHGMEAGVVRKTLYIPGGGDVGGFGAVDTHTRLDLARLLE